MVHGTYMETRGVVRVVESVGRVTDLEKIFLPPPPPPPRRRPKFHRESKILSRVQREEKISIRGKYGNFLIETEIPPAPIPGIENTKWDSKR